MTVELAVEISTKYSERPVIRAEYRDNDIWKLVELKRPKKIHPTLWSAYINIAIARFRGASAMGMVKSIDWNTYPLNPKKALAVHIGNTIRYGKVVKPMDGDILYVLT